jgi:iron-sulfur cluster repair protein YtfE (RIC family)
MTIDPALTVNQLVQQHPAALPVLAAAGVDTCCGGGLSLAVAVRGAGLTLEELAHRLEAGSTSAGQEGARSCGCGPREE